MSPWCLPGLFHLGLSVAKYKLQAASWNSCEFMNKYNKPSPFPGGSQLSRLCCLGLPASDGLRLVHRPQRMWPPPGCPGSCTFPFQTGMHMDPDELESPSLLKSRPRTSFTFPYSFADSNSSESSRVCILKFDSFLQHQEDVRHWMPSDLAVGAP